MTAAPNNNFADAIVITSLPYTSPAYANVDNDRETGEPVADSHSQRTAWWKWVADVDQNVIVDSHQTTTVGGTGPGFEPDTQLAVWTGATLTGLTLVDWNDDFNAGVDIYTSQVTFTAEAGTTYYFQLAQFGFGLPSSNVYILNVVGGATGPPSNPTLDVDTSVRRRPL